MAVKSRNIQLMGVAILAFVLVFSGHTYAQSSKELRKSAKSQLTSMKNLNWPQDRCSFGIQVLDNIRVIAKDHPVLKTGDRIVKLAGSEVPKSIETFIQLLNDIPPDARPPAVIERDGDLMEVTLECKNARPHQEMLIKGLKEFRKKRYDDCFETFNRSDHTGSTPYFWKAQCAFFSKKNKSNLSTAMYQLAEENIESAMVNKTIRPQIMMELRSRRSMIGDFDNLVAMTRNWPGGETAWDDSEPDYAQFRNTGERAVKARMIDPGSTNISWPFGFTWGVWQTTRFSQKVEGYWTCGTFNSRNRMGGYSGASYFGIVFSPNGDVLLAELGENKGEFELDFVRESCKKGVEFLPPPQLGLKPQRKGKTIDTNFSLADELGKLLELKKMGALTEEEFNSEKERLLNRQ